MIDISTVEVLTFLKKEEGKMFHISFKDNEEEDAIERVFSNVDWNPVVEEHLEE